MVYVCAWVCVCVCVWLGEGGGGGSSMWDEEKKISGVRKFLTFPPLMRTIVNNVNYDTTTTTAAAADDDATRPW